LTPSRTFRPTLYTLLPNAFRRGARDERGSTVVETALSLGLLSMLIFGVFETCLAVYSYHFLANAAHEGARYAIVRGARWSVGCDGGGNAGSGYASAMCTASTADIANYVVQRSFPGILLTASNVCVEYLGPTPGSATTTCDAGNSIPADNAPGDIVQVTVSYPFTLNVPGLPAKRFTMSSTSQMVIAE
jgi:Flp pilus assembly protein TadG